MNILIVSPDLESGGVASVVQNLTQHLRSRGHNVRMLYSGSSVLIRPMTSRLGQSGSELRFQAPFGERNPVVSLLSFIALFPIGLVQLAWLIWHWRIQVVNIHYASDDLFYFAICRRLLRFRLICSVHGADLFPSGKPAVKYSRSIRMLLEHSDCIVTPSQDFRSKLAEKFPEYSNKTVPIHNGVDFAAFSNKSSDAHFAPTERYVLTVSACKEQKALDVLIHSMKVVNGHYPDVKLVVVGEGPLRGDLELLAASLGLTGCIQFLGRKSHREVIELLHHCEIFVLPSRFETFGIALVEAMACGKPVIATNTGGLPEIVRDRVNGFLVEPENPERLAECMNILLGDIKLQRQLGKAGFECSTQRFSVANMGAGYERLFQAKADRAGLMSVSINRSATVSSPNSKDRIHDVS